jgi:DNA polymerase III epsilon subunit-like protein
VDTLTLLRRYFHLPSNRLGEALTALQVEASPSHSALSDAQATAQLLCRILQLLGRRRHLSGLSDLMALHGTSSHWSAPPPHVPPRIRQLIRRRMPVQVRYRLDGETKTWRGVLIHAALGSDRGYYSLEFPGGTRICLRSDRVRSISPL